MALRLALESALASASAETDYVPLPLAERPCGGEQQEHGRQLQGPPDSEACAKSATQATVQEESGESRRQREQAKMHWTWDPASPNAAVVPTVAKTLGEKLTNRIGARIA